MKQSFQITAKKGIKKLKVKLPESMPDGRYSIVKSVLNYPDNQYDPSIVMEVPSETKTSEDFVIQFNDKVPYKLVMAVIVEEFQG